ncbi:AP-3 complex subunit mu-2-like [Xenia sp. Carnegie-2017]|uniref:AP-3 complex subunit mu-2-like n=1 Tax=Xenia sp. Carnegie-2017 TaxID=2897299 RepID=UPI001F04CE5B|nr:AP-3 complex subunit mu-2-like [Xenia sp. Carnegie-2017]
MWPFVGGQHLQVLRFSKRYKAERRVQEMDPTHKLRSFKATSPEDIKICINYRSQDVFYKSSFLEDVSFHPCLRFRRWESERILSFVPPDGPFRLISYNVATGVNMLPLFAKPRVLFQEGGSGTFELLISSKPVMGKNIENVDVTVPFPKQVLNLNLSTNVGTYTFDPIEKELSWEVGS